MATNLPIGRQIFAVRFRELAEQFKAPKAATLGGETFAGMNASEAAGELFIETVDRGYLQSLPGACELVAGYREAKARYDAGDGVGFIEGKPFAYPTKPQALRVPCPTNLFIDVAGDDRIEVYNNGGQLEAKRYLPPKGLLPDAVRGMFPAANWPLNPNHTDEAQDFITLARAGAADRYALACRLLAELLEQEQAANNDGADASGDNGGDDSAGDEPRPADIEQPSLEARALALLTDHPDWSKKRIADTLVCDRTHLYRLPKFIAACEMLKHSGRASLARGSKTDGHVEAWEADE